MQISANYVTIALGVQIYVATDEIAGLFSSATFELLSNIWQCFVGFPIPLYIQSFWAQATFYQQSDHPSPELLRLTNWILISLFVQLFFLASAARFHRHLKRDWIVA